MKVSLVLFCFLFAFFSFGAHSIDVYDSPIVKRLGIIKPPPIKLDRSFGTSSAERRLALFLDEHYARHRQMTITLNNFFLSHPMLPLSIASFSVSNLNAIVKSKAWIKLSKSNHNILIASERHRFCEQVKRDFDRCYRDLAFFRDYDDRNQRDPEPIADPQPPALPIALDSTSFPGNRPKKKNWSFAERMVGFDHEAESRRQQEFERRLALQQEYSRRRDNAQLQLHEAERQRWFAEQQRIQAERTARENLIPSFQGGLDSQAEISRQQQMWAEQQKRDAEMRANQFP